jgi:hypothetical protein
VNSRQRFLETMRGGRPDHPPLFPEGIRDDVLRAWQRQGLPRGKKLGELFYYDEFEELAPDVYPVPYLRDWSQPGKVLRELRRRLDPDDARRLPKDWQQQVKHWQGRQHPLLLRLHQGLFLTLGIEDWRRFREAILLLVDEPVFVHEVLALQAEFVRRFAENILRQVDVDAVVFSEPIAGNHGSLVSPRMYREYLLSSLAPVFEILASYHVPVIIWRSYANPRALIPEVARSPFNAIWVCEAPWGAMDYNDLRRTLGDAMGLIGGIDSDVLRLAQEDIRSAVRAVLPLVQQGRFVPLADGRVRSDVSFQNYAFYRRILEDSLLAPAVLYG